MSDSQLVMDKIKLELELSELENSYKDVAEQLKQRTIQTLELKVLNQELNAKLKELQG